MFVVFSRLDSFFTISTQRNLYASRLFLVSLVPWIDKPWGNTVREKLHEPCACSIQIGGAKEHQQQHLKELFLKGFVDGKPVIKMLVDGGVAVNIMPYVMLRKLGKNQDDLTKTDMMLKDFEGVVSPALGALCVDLTIGSKTLPTTFFIINGKGSYSLLLGRD